MSSSLPLLTSLVTGFGLALPFGYLAERFLRTPALVGYILAGVSAGLIPGLPAVDESLLEQTAEIGVMLLMFGVGLHFSVRDLVSVKGVALPGAVAQMALATLLGTLFGHFVWGWNFGSAVLFGLTLSCASTVVVTKALEIRGLTYQMNGQVAVGWLVVQDLVTVFIMVCLPPFAQVVLGEGNVSGAAIVGDLAKTLAGVVLFVVLMMVAGKKALPWVLKLVAATGSRELFTLAVVLIAIGIAYGATAIFEVSYALGAFFAGMVMQESRYAHRAAKNSLPLQDAFAVLFFVSVGMMLDWRIFIDRPVDVLFVAALILLGTTSVSFGLVLLLRWPLDTALTLAACVAQIGEFSFILAAQGINLGLADKGLMSLVVAASIVTIAVNPVFFAMIPKVRNRLVLRFPWAKKAAVRQPPHQELPKDAGKDFRKGQIIVVGWNEGVRQVLEGLRAADRRIILVVPPSAPLNQLEAQGFGVISGDATDPMILVEAHVTSASVMLLALQDEIRMKRVFDVARELNNRLKIVVRLRNHSSIALFPADAQTVVVDEELVVSVALASNVVAVSKGRVPDGTEDEDEAGEAALAARRLFEDEYRRAVARIREGSPTGKPVVPNTPEAEAALARIRADEAAREAKKAAQEGGGAPSPATGGLETASPKAEELVEVQEEGEGIELPKPDADGRGRPGLGGLKDLWGRWTKR